MQSSPGCLFLIPCPLGDVPPELVLPMNALAVARHLQHFVVEHPKTARKFLAAAKPANPIGALNLATLNEHTSKSELANLLAPLLAGHDLGLISEAGCPGVADPGAELVNLCHRKGIRVVPLVGPSSILLALMASGMNGQRFAFHGYLPISDPARSKMLIKLEAESAKLNQTQIFMETPYRNERMFHAILAHCRPGTRLCVATDITLPGENILTHTIIDWKSQPTPPLDRHPTIFLLESARG
jgi:16S rRNA (cytidine1402-2'-O)-methyltransferase